MVLQPVRNAGFSPATPFTPRTERGSDHVGPIVRSARANPEMVDFRSKQSREYSSEKTQAGNGPDPAGEPSDGAARPGKRKTPHPDGAMLPFRYGSKNSCPPLRAADGRVRTSNRPRFRPANPGTKGVETGRSRQKRAAIVELLCRAFTSHGRS